MSTIIRLRGVNFNNASLPVVSSFVRNGLVAAFRPAGDESSLVDLSGNSTQLTKVGTPTFTTQGVKGQNGSGYVTNVAETADITVMAVYRCSPIAGTMAGGLVVNTFNDDDAAGNKYGFSLWTKAYAGTGANKLDVKALYQTFLKRNSDNTYQNSPFGVLIQDEMDNTVSTDWIFGAMVIDASNNKVKRFVPKLYPTGPYNETDGTALGLSVAGRILTNPTTGLPNYVNILEASDNDAWNTPVELAEVLIYQRALTDVEIFQQYALSKEFMSKLRSIVI